MKKFTTTEVIDLLIQVMMGEISFFEMVEEINQRVSEAGGAPAELKEGDLVIFWNFNKGTSMIGEYDYSLKDTHYPHKDKMGNIWANAIKFESKEQFERLLKGEI